MSEIEKRQFAHWIPLVILLGAFTGIIIGLILREGLLTVLSYGMAILLGISAPFAIVRLLLAWFMNYARIEELKKESEDKNRE